MTLTKAELINAVQEELGYSKNKSSEIVESLIEIIKSTLACGDDVLVSGFGKFRIKKKAERRGRNPATGDEVMLNARKVVRFKCSGKLREMINGNGKKEPKFKNIEAYPSYGLFK